jgi:triosephosphate isomerase
MLLSVGVEFVILGHSERRQFFNESNELLAQKVDTVLTKGLLPIFCCGEPLEIREAKTHVDYVKKQLEEGLFHLDAASFSNVVIAYEPIWAIGTGVTASKEQAQDMHREIRTLISNRYDDEIAQRISILYGGSVKPDNASELFAQPDVDGGLVGGASLKADDFTAIINSF